MKNSILLAALLLTINGFGQGPQVTSWLQNNSQTGTYYMQGNSTTFNNGILYNCQEISYSTNNVYVKTNGVPAYPTGPFLDGNPSVAESQNLIYQFPLNPQENTGTPTPTTMGTIGVFINGVSLYDYRDGVAWDDGSNALCGGPGNTPCPGGPGAVMDWNRDAIPAEMAGFDCSKGHPAMGQYHHHQNPSAFKLDLDVVSNICNLYDADGLYAIDSTQHSPLIGYAYDGFPIYGAYGYKNADGTGGIVRIRTSYELGTTPDRTTYPDGTDVPDGPAFDATYFRGYFKEDYLYVSHPGQEEFLDEHNGRFCVTPEYPAGTYAYFCTVDENWNSAFPYAVGPTFYGVYANREVTSISEQVTVYNGSTSLQENIDNLNINVFPNPATDLVAVQVSGVLHEDLQVELIDMTGRTVASTKISSGQTIAYFNVDTVYSGSYIVRIANEHSVSDKKIMIQ
ncbi:MAG: YHYH protein [Crocinitomicaceae bacterium]